MWWQRIKAVFGRRRVSKLDDTEPTALPRMKAFARVSDTELCMLCGGTQFRFGDKVRPDGDVDLVCVKCGV